MKGSAPATSSGPAAVATPSEPSVAVCRARSRPRGGRCRPIATAAGIMHAVATEPTMSLAGPKRFSRPAVGIDAKKVTSKPLAAAPVAPAR